MRNRRLFAAGLASLAAAGMASTYLLGRARAAGAPATQPLTYSGTLTDAAGVPLVGTRSIQIAIWDMAAGAEVVNLEDFSVWKDGKQLQSPDHNFWGVTFDPSDSRHFFATLGTKGHTYLVSGDLAARKVNILRDGVECPDLSPDGTRIAFKQRTSAGGADLPTWQLAVLDLATLADHPLAEARTVDDQAEWLDNSTVAYAVDTGVGAPSTYTTPADGTGTPRLLVTDADSPSVAR